MKKIKLLSLLLMVSLFSGCVYLIVGGIGALGGYVVSPDTVEGVAEVEDVEVWDTAVDVVSIMGTITEQYESSGIIIAKVSNAKVTLSITPITNSATKVTVKARRYNLPRISTAQDVFVKVMTQLVNRK